MWSCVIEIKRIARDNSYSLCKKEVSKHLHTTSVTDISTENDRILTRAGVFEYDEEYISTEQQCAQSTNISSVEDGSRNECVATQTTLASQIVVLTNCNPKSYFMS